MGECVGAVWALWGTVGELWELLEVDLKLGSGGTTLGKGKFGVWEESCVKGSVN